jgi:DNA-binding MarR family transcriptional regulator
VDSQQRLQLTLLEALSEDGQTTQRGLSRRFGIALGLTNLYLKRLVRKGYVKCVNGKPNRLVYLVTPSGLAEKTRLTYEFMEYSLRLYREARTRVRTVLEPIVRDRALRVAIYGAGEGPQLAYMCLKELGIAPIALFMEETTAVRMFDLPVHHIDDHASVGFDVLVVATFDNPVPVLAALQQRGIEVGRLVPIREPVRVT